ncbi:hypothetical protein E4U26_002747 [Claviceps purpurea]|nr:hypothetical protein E4U26_002747 [Claviceps purpurea]KAG6260615.1 hypothetical protein E4U49_004688 [Claviceps purpurea]
MFSVEMQTLVDFCEWKPHRRENGCLITRKVDCGSTTCKDSESYVPPSDEWHTARGQSQ